MTAQTSMTPGPANAITDVAGITVGSAEDSERPTGTTIVVAARPVTAAAAVTGGAPGTRGVTILQDGSIETGVDAVVLSGGSAYGLDAVGGAMDVLRRAGRGYAMGPARVPIIPGAIIFDLLTGSSAAAPTGWEQPPWFDLGRRAAEEALAGNTTLPLGNAGAGMGARAGGAKGGQGTASLIWEAGGRTVTTAAVAVANPIGRVLVPGSRAFWAAPFERNGEFGAVPMPAGPLPADALDFPFEFFSTGTATTLAVVATTLDLTRGQCARVARMAHDGFARAIRPVHTPLDGDSVFVLATGETPVENPVADTARAGMMAADCIARAIARGVHAATAIPGMPAWRDLDDAGVPKTG
ncbi:MAG: P1 family peptidase [Pseudomonadota bacterium]